MYKMQTHLESIRLRRYFMKKSKDKERRISNLKDMINNVKSDESESVQSNLDDFEYDNEMEEDGELIEYLNEDKVDDIDSYEIDDEFIYHPGKGNEDSVSLEDDSIDEDFLINTNDMDEAYNKEFSEIYENEEFSDEFDDEFEPLDDFLNEKIGKSRILPILGTILGILFIIAGIFVFNSRSDRVIDNVVSGETSFISVVLILIGLLVLIYGIYNLFSLKNPFEGISNSLESVENNDKQDEKTLSKIDDDENTIPKSNIPLDKESYKIGEFNMDDIKNRLKKPTASKDMPVEENIDDIPPAKEKSDYKKGLTSEEIEELEYNQAVREHETIDDIFSEMDDID